MASTLSDLLESTLIDIQHDTTNNNNNNSNSSNNSVSGVSLLLSERRKLRDAGKAHQEEDYIRFTPLTSSSTKGHNTLLDQIATSNLDNITTTSKNRTTTAAIPITNVRKSKQQKGQAYNDKSLSKKASKQSRKDRMDKYKRSY